MDLTMADLVEQTGVAPRTIREYVRLEILPRPRGTGPAALYSREHLLRLWAIVHFRAEGVQLDEIKKGLARMSLREIARFKPKAPAPTPAPPEAEAPGQPGAPPPLGPDPEHAQLPPRGRAPRADLAGAGPHGDEGLPDGPRWAIVALLPGMALMVRDDAPRIVRRAAREIIERYGSNTTG
ncbi:MAG TPA: helix-turn-helix domain-containing protein [Polyangiaceae bacterium]|jgi:DNA-binding transcriptional MerR regulator